MPVIFIHRRCGYVLHHAFMFSLPPVQVDAVFIRIFAVILNNIYFYGGFIGSCALAIVAISQKEVCHPAPGGIFIRAS